MVLAARSPRRCDLRLTRLAIPPTMYSMGNESTTRSRFRTNTGEVDRPGQKPAHGTGQRKREHNAFRRPERKCIGAGTSHGASFFAAATPDLLRKMVSATSSAAPNAIFNA